MGYEPAIPKVPTREQEIKSIEQLAQSYIDQPYSKYYSPESYRINKMELAEKMNRAKRDWAINFAVGSPA
jgi:hypothetical protein